MTSRELFVHTIKVELPRFDRAIKAAPKSKAKLAWRPHAKTRTGWELMSVTFGMEAGMFPEFLKKGELDFATFKTPVCKTNEDVAKALKKYLTQTQKMVAAMSEEEWENGVAVMKTNGKVEWKTTKAEMSWELLHDLIHHRGQLMIYLRPMGAKVPSIYGPSGDSN